MQIYIYIYLYVSVAEAAVPPWSVVHLVCGPLYGYGLWYPFVVFGPSCMPGGGTQTTEENKDHTPHEGITHHREGDRPQCGPQTRGHRQHTKVVL